MMVKKKLIGIAKVRKRRQVTIPSKIAREKDYILFYEREEGGKSEIIIETLSLRKFVTSPTERDKILKALDKLSQKTKVPKEQLIKIFLEELLSK